jgi:hypothetical protein
MMPMIALLVAIDVGILAAVIFYLWTRLDDKRRRSSGSTPRTRSTDRGRPPGWYRDPWAREGPDQERLQRWWAGDEAGWTHRTRSKPGWFLDPDGTGLLRLWDGDQWTNRYERPPIRLCQHAARYRVKRPDQRIYCDLCGYRFPCQHPAPYRVKRPDQRIYCDLCGYRFPCQHPAPYWVKRSDQRMSCRLCGYAQPCWHPNKSYSYVSPLGPDWVCLGCGARHYAQRYDPQLDPNRPRP